MQHVHHAVNETAGPHGPRSHVTIEACVASVGDAVAASRGGADRLELNVALERDGLTPPLRLFEAVREAVDLPIIAMVRPHDSGFAYEPSEISGMVECTRRFMEAGATGVATGPLTAAGHVAVDDLLRLVEACGDGELVFHRAFDTLEDRAKGLETLVECGVCRVLTSGGAPTAAAGIPSLARLVQQAGDRIEVLPGAGIGPSNAAEIVLRTGSRQLHGTFRMPGSAAGTDARIVFAVRARAEAATGSPGESSTAESVSTPS